MRMLHNLQIARKTEEILLPPAFAISCSVYISIKEDAVDTLNISRSLFSVRRKIITESIEAETAK